MSDQRTPGFRRNDALEDLLLEIGGDLQPAESRMLARFGGRPMPYPLILVMGPLRSGTTLFMQWLAATGLVAYPTNLLSRFYLTPIVGAKIQKLLTDPRYRFRDELEEFTGAAVFESENGKTRGALSPNEFWYFWRRFLPLADRDVWTDEELRSGMDLATLRTELTGMMHVFGKPFAAKAMLFNYNIAFLDSAFAKVLFVQLKRDPVENVASVLDARRRQLGRDTAWYSFRIPEYELLQGLDALPQAAGQVLAINRAVDQGMRRVAASRRLCLSYEHFCSNPAAVFEQLAELLQLPEADRCYQGPQRFRLTRRTQGADAREIQQALVQAEERLDTRFPQPRLGGLGQIDA